MVTAFCVCSKEEREGRIAELREELEDLNENKRMFKTKDQPGRQREAGREDRDEEERIGGRKEVFFSLLLT